MARDRGETCDSPGPYLQSAPRCNNSVASPQGGQLRRYPTRHCYRATPQLRWVMLVIPAIHNRGWVHRVTGIHSHRSQCRRQRCVDYVGDDVPCSRCTSRYQPSIHSGRPLPCSKTIELQLGFLFGECGPGPGIHDGTRRDRPMAFTTKRRAMRFSRAAL